MRLRALNDLSRTRLLHFMDLNRKSLWLFSLLGVSEDAALFLVCPQNEPLGVYPSYRA